MQYSVRTRRRLRPHTGELTRGQVAAAKQLAGVPEDEFDLAQGTGTIRALPITGPVIERIAPRARRGCGDR